MKNKRPLRKVLGWTLYVTAILIFFGIILEVCYRYYYFDFYWVENQALNKDVSVSDKKTVLFLGDSYTAGGTYIERLRDSLPEINIVNAAVPGTGIREASIIAPDRIRQYHPDIIVVQVYTGNDFTDIRHDLNFEKLSVSRNIYWWLSDRLLSLRYINYKMGQFKGAPQQEPKADAQFNAATYSDRQKILFQAHSAYLSDAIKMQGAQKKKIVNWFEYFDDICALAGDTVSVCVLMIPQCAQVAPRYAARMEQLGSVPLQDPEMLSPNCALNQYFDDECKTRSVDFFNTQALLQQADSCGRSVYFENDPHLSPVGDSMLTEYLKVKLRVLLQ